MPLHPKQVVARQSFGQIANNTAGAQADDLLRAIDDELQMPLRMRVTGEYTAAIDDMVVQTPISDNRGNTGTSFQGYLDLTGDAFGAQLDNAQAGEYWIVKNSSNPTSIFGTNSISLDDMDYLICNTNVTGTPTDGADFGKGTAGSDRKRSGSPINGKLPFLPGGATLTFTNQGTPGSFTVTPSVGSAYDIGAAVGTWSSGAYLRLGINLNENGQVTFDIGTPNVTEASATVPAVPAGQFGVGHIVLLNDGGTVRPLAQEHILQYTSAGGGSQVSEATSDTTGIVTSFAPIIKDSVLATSSSYTILDDDGYSHIAFTTGSGSVQTITLPTAADNKGRMISVTKVDTGTTAGFVKAEAGDSIDGVTSPTFWRPYRQYDTMNVISDGNDWYRAGAVPRYYFFSDALDGDFTGGTIKGVRVGDTVTLTWSTVSHTSSTQRATTGTFIPEEFRPWTQIRNVYNNEGGGVHFLQLNTSGEFRIIYSSAQTGSDGGTISYIVTDI